MQLKKTKISIIIGLSEIRRREENIIPLKEGGIFCYKGNDKGQRGVGFWISQELEENFKEFRGISDRIALSRFKFKRNTIITLIQVYAPT